MTYRVTGARGGTSVVERSLLQLARGLESLARRVEKIESSNRTMPPGLRFELEIDDAGERWLVVERVGTGNRERIAGPL